MKKRLLFFTTIFICIISAILLIFIPLYNNSPKLYASTYLDNILKSTNNHDKQNTVNIENLAFEMLKNSSLGCVLVDPDNYQQTFFNNIKDGLSNVKYNITNISKSQDIATIDVSINYFKLDKIVENGKTIFSNQYQNSYMSTDETIKTIYNIIEAEFNKGPSTQDTTTVTLHMHRQNYKWIPDPDFEITLLNAIFQS